MLLCHCMKAVHPVGAVTLCRGGKAALEWRHEVWHTRDGEPDELCACGKRGAYHGNVIADSPRTREGRKP